MTIKNMTPQLAEAGKIKIGWLGEERTSKTGSTYRQPERLDHFLITTTQRGDDGLLVIDEDVMSRLDKDDDGKVRRLPVVLPFDDIAANFATAYVAYAGRSQLACRGDGERALQHIRKGKPLDPPEPRKCPCRALEVGQCRATGRLSVILDVPGVRTLGAAHVWRTSGGVSIASTMGSLEAIAGALGGQIAGRPMWLVVRPIDHRRGKFWSCHLELRESDTRASWGAIDAAPLPELGTESAEEVAEIQAEFYPRGDA